MSALFVHSTTNGYRHLMKSGIGIRDGPLETWWGGGVGGEKKQKKINARENAKKTNSCKEEGKEKKFRKI